MVRVCFWSLPEIGRIGEDSSKALHGGVTRPGLLRKREPAVFPPIDSGLKGGCWFPRFHQASFIS